MTKPLKAGPWEELRLFDIEQVGPPETQQRVREVESWWMNQALQEAEVLIPRAVEYGAKDLELMGEGLFMMLSKVHPDVPKEEVAIAFYVLGKIARIIGAYEEGRVPKDDSWDDLAIYARMAKYVREHGKWM